MNRARIEAVELQADMVAMWADLLVADEVGPTSQFFKLGGDSVTATALMAWLEDRYGVVIDPIQVFDTPVLSGFTQVVLEAIEAEPAQDIEEGTF